MDEPEDLLQLVLGMTSPTLFTDLFSKGSQCRGQPERVVRPEDRALRWVDVVQTVRDLVGNARQFDFQQVSDRLPRVDCRI